MQYSCLSALCNAATLPNLLICDKFDFKYSFNEDILSTDAAYSKAYVLYYDAPKFHLKK